MCPASVPLWLGKRPARHTRHGLAWRQRCIANLKNATCRAEGRMWLDGAAARPIRPTAVGKTSRNVEEMERARGAKTSTGESCLAECKRVSISSSSSGRLYTHTSGAQLCAYNNFAVRAPEGVHLIPAFMIMVARTPRCRTQVSPLQRTKTTTGSSTSGRQ